MKPIVSFMTLFTSMSTLFCCALPALFVLLGFGASFATLTEAVPQILWLGQHKGLVFLFGGICLCFSAALQFRFTAPESCDIEEGACEETRNWSRPMLAISVMLYIVGGFFAYGAPALLS